MNETDTLEITVTQAELRIIAEVLSGTPNFYHRDVADRSKVRVENFEVHTQRRLADRLQAQLAKTISRHV